MHQYNNMKPTILALIFIGLTACNQDSHKIKALQNKTDSLEIKLNETYKPGFGEFMSHIQSHHAKLWFAGENQNWKLAGFEVGEIRETFENIQKYQPERKESQLIRMISPSLDSVEFAIEKGDILLFKKNFTLLTSTCNQCHHETGFGFNAVIIPEQQTFSNQNFKIAQ